MDIESVNGIPVDINLDDEDTILNVSDDVPTFKSKSAQIKELKESLDNLAIWMESVINGTVGFPLFDAKTEEGPLFATLHHARYILSGNPQTDPDISRIIEQCDKSEKTDENEGDYRERIDAIKQLAEKMSNPINGTKP